MVVGLTGSIAMGKSTVARMFAELGCPVFDADAAVRDFYSSDGAAPIESAFPGVVEGGVVNRERLAARALGDKDAMARIEAIVHPAVAERRAGFIEDARRAGHRVVVLDIPLLFETHGEASVDVVVVVSASPEIQRARALAREGATPAKFEAILARQTPDRVKRQHAHFIIDTNGSLVESRAQVEALIRAIVGMPGREFRHA